MGLFQAVGTVLHKYFDFSSRATRSEFWLYTLFLYLLYAFIGAAEFCLYYFTIIDEYILYMSFLIINTVVLFALLVPTIAVSVRRLHDINKSGANLFLYLIPIIGGIILLIFYCKKSFQFTNKYGDPVNKKVVTENTSKKSSSIVEPEVTGSVSSAPRIQPWKD